MPKSLFRRLTKNFIVVINIAAAILFLIACYERFFKTEFSWVFGFLTIASFYLLAILVIFIFFWLFVKPKFVLISVLGILLAYKQVENIIPFRLSSSFTIQKKTEALRVMSWNVASFDVLNYSKTRNTKVFHQMFRLVNEYNPDIACFQEMAAGDTVISFENQSIKRFSDSLHFPYSSFCYLPKEDWFVSLHFGIVIFSKYPVINQKTITHEPEMYNSTFQYIDIVKNGDTIRVFNIHLESLRFTAKNFDYLHKDIEEKAKDLAESKNIIHKMKQGLIRRRRQADWIKEEINNSPYPVIVCGDLNDVPNSYAYQTIGDGLQNAFVEKGNGIGRTFTGISPTLRIDNIFVDKKFTVEQYTRIRKKLSDHFPIVADISTQTGK